MKHFAISCAVLAVILALCIGNALWLKQQCEGWTAQLAEVDTLARSDQWDTAAETLASVYDDWQSAQTWLHITTEHDDLVDAESLFCRSLVLADEQDSEEFRAHIAELNSVLQYLLEMAQLRIENVL